MLTAEWEARLKEVERGELAPEEFMKGIADMSRHLVETHNAPEEEFAGALSGYEKKREGGRWYMPQVRGSRV